MRTLSMNLSKLWIMLCGTLITISGCNTSANLQLPELASTAVSIAEANPTTTVTATLIPTVAPLPTETPTSEPTATFTPLPPTETPTPVIPSVIVLVNLNVRSGPGTNYDRVGLLQTGTTVEIIGQNADASWWQIRYPEAPEAIAWISASPDFGTAENTEGVLVAAIPSTPTPSIPTATPIPTRPPIDFVIVQQRLWTNEENGGISPNGSASNCGYGHEIYVTVIDAAGNPLDGIVIGDIYNNPHQITGSKGPGRAQYLLYFNGYNLLVVEDTSAGRPVTSETSHVLSAKDEEIPVPWLISSHYCANEAECVERISKNSLCRGHYSYDIVFQRAW